MANRVLSGLSWTAGSSLARNLVSLLQITILTRILAKSDFGLLAVANLFVNFTTMFLDMGISTGIMYRKDTTKRVYSSLFWLNVLTGTVLTLVLILAAPLLTKAYHSDDLTNVIRLLSLGLLLNSLGSQQRIVCQKEFLFKRIALIEIAASLVTFAVAFITARNGCGVYSLAYSSIAGVIVNNLSHLFLGLTRNHGLSFHFNLKETFPYLKIGIWQIGSSILDFLSRELDVFIVSATLGLEFLGVYSIAKKIPTVLYSFVSPIVSKVVTPLFATINDNIQKLKEKYLLITKAISWYAFPMYLAIAAVAPTVMKVAFGQEYVEGAPVLSVFCIIYAFNSIWTICGSLQTALGRTDIGFYWTVYRIISTAVVYYFSSRMGINAFLIGMLVLLAINTIVGWRMQYKAMIGVRLFEYFDSFFIALLVSGALALTAGLIDYQPDVTYSIVAGILMLVLFLAIMLVTRERRYVEVVCSQVGITLPEAVRKHLS